MCAENEHESVRRTTYLPLHIEDALCRLAQHRRIPENELIVEAVDVCLGDDDIDSELDGLNDSEGPIEPVRRTVFLPVELDDRLRALSMRRERDEGVLIRDCVGLHCVEETRKILPDFSEMGNVSQIMATMSNLDTPSVLGIPSNFPYRDNAETWPKMTLSGRFNTLLKPRWMRGGFYEITQENNNSFAMGDFEGKKASTAKSSSKKAGHVRKKTGLKSFSGVIDYGRKKTVEESG